VSKTFHAENAMAYLNLRRASRLLLLAGLAVCLSSCGQSSATPTAPASTVRSSVPATRSTATPSTAPAGNLNIAATCKDVAAIRTINEQFNSGTVTLARGRGIARSLKAAADDLVANITDDTSTDARTYDSAIGTLLQYTDRASSLAQLHSEAASDTTLKPAVADASTSLENLISWHAANCPS
jgi:glucose/arabinose dehydrogenase